MQDQITVLAAKLQDTSGQTRVHLLLDLAFEYRDLDAQHGVILCQEAAALALQYGDTTSQALAMVTEAMNWMRLGENENARHMLEDAHHLARTGRNTFILAKVWHGFGILEETQGNFYHSLYYFLKCEGSPEISHNPWLYCSILASIALSYDHLKEHEKAFMYHERSLKLALATEREDVYFYVINNIGHNRSCLGLYDQALSYFNEARAIAISQQREYGVMLATAGLAETYTALRDFNRARSYAENAMTQARALKDKRILADILADSAQIYMYSKDYSDALDCLEEALVLARDMGGFYNALRYHLLMADAYEHLNQTQQAVMHLQTVISTSADSPTTAQLIAYQRLITLLTTSGNLTAAAAYQVQWEQAQATAKANHERHLKIMTQVETLSFEPGRARQLNLAVRPLDWVLPEDAHTMLEESFERAHHQFGPLAVVVLAVDQPDLIPANAKPQVHTSVTELLHVTGSTLFPLLESGAVTFLLLLSDRPAHEVLRLARKLIKRIEGLRWASHSTLRVTASAGCCTTTGWAQADDMFRAGTRLLLQAQGLGGNRVLATATPADRV